MTREEMAKRLFAAYYLLPFEELTDKECAEQPMFEHCLRMADVALAECAKAAEEGYEEGFGDGHEYGYSDCQDGSGPGATRSQCDEAWTCSETRAKWGGK